MLRFLDEDGNEMGNTLILLSSLIEKSGIKKSNSIDKSKAGEDTNNSGSNNTDSGHHEEKIEMGLGPLGTLSLPALPLQKYMPSAVSSTSSKAPRTRMEVKMTSGGVLKGVSSFGVRVSQASL